MGFLSREKLVILILLLQLVIFAVGFLDGILRKNASKNGTKRVPKPFKNTHQNQCPETAKKQ